jgi:uncharacterized coiled-coil protein SlyX
MSAKLEQDLAAVGECLAALARRVTAIETVLDGLRAEFTELNNRLTAVQAEVASNPGRGLFK